MPPQIQFKNVSYYHPGADKTAPPALNDINLTIEAGEFVAIVGANGSGKTTLARHCNALLAPSAGEVSIAGLDTRQPGNLAGIRAKVGMVFQNPEDQIVATVIEEDTAFGPENLGLPSLEIRSRVDSSLNLVKMWQQRDRPPHLLSAGQKQRVALAGVLAMLPQCIIFDESTAMLDPRGRLDVMAEMQSLHERGITVLFITHFMEEAARANRVIVMNEGNLVFDGTPRSLFSNTDLLTDCGLEQPQTLLLSSRLGKLHPLLAGLPSDFEQLLAALPTYPSKAGLPEAGDKSNHHELLVRISGLNHTYLPDTPLAQQSLFDIAMETQKEAAHGLVGATGSGKSTLLQHLNGLYRPQTGQVQIGPYDCTNPDLDLKALRRYAGLVFQNPEVYFFEQYVGDEIAYGPRMFYGRQGLKERVQEAMRMVGLDFEKFKDRITYTLSGGEKRKVALAATLAVQPGLMILDEPTAGLDPASRRNLHATLREAQQKGIELILSSHSMGDITELTRNMTILANGRALKTGDTADIFNDRELILSSGLGQPSVVRLAGALRSRNWPIPIRSVTAEQLFAAIEAIRKGEA